MECTLELALGFSLVIVGFAIFISGLCGIIGSFRTAHPANGMGNVTIAFLGFTVLLVGLVVAGRQDMVAIILKWIDWLGSEKGLTVCLVTGVILAAFVRKNEG